MYSPTTASITKAVAMSLWKDTSSEPITRESAARIAERWQVERINCPDGASSEWQNGWETACETIALALRFRT